MGIRPMRAARTGWKTVLPRSQAVEAVSAPAQFHDNVQDQSQNQKPGKEMDGMVESGFQNTVFFLTMAVGADLLHISSLALLQKDQICHISGKNADDDFVSA